MEKMENNYSFGQERIEQEECLHGEQCIEWCSWNQDYLSIFLELIRPIHDLSILISVIKKFVNFLQLMSFEVLSRRKYMVYIVNDM